MLLAFDFGTMVSSALTTISSIITWILGEPLLLGIIGIFIVLPIIFGVIAGLRR